MKRLAAEAKDRPIEAFVLLCAVAIAAYTIYAIVLFLIGKPPS